MRESLVKSSTDYHSLKPAFAGFTASFYLSIATRIITSKVHADFFS